MKTAALLREMDRLGPWYGDPETEGCARDAGAAAMLRSSGRSIPDHPRAGVCISAPRVGEADA